MSTAAAAAAVSGLHCEVWQPQDFSETHCSFSSSSSESPEFFIDFYVSSYATQGDQIISTLRYKNFRQRCDVLTQDSFSWSAISTMLSETNVPYHLQPFFIQQISISARGIATEPTNALSRTIPMVVELVLPEEAMEDSSYGSDTIMGTGSRRASRASIQEMERVEMNGVLSDCVICLDDIVSVGSEIDALRMPCLHIYHRNCIHKWLQLSNRCPLCRFQMPLEEE